ncbi:MAG: hypothetical protein K0S18_31 [Anaerocolumna sp.]|jgi:hypothetical protein|nr:hypothetical protein [Anaerocolumna sp.]
MNLIDFHVTKIISEEKDVVYKLLNITKEQVDNETEELWKNFLLGNGVKQTYEYWDDGGTRIDTEIFNLDKNQKPYYVGYVGQH